MTNEIESSKLFNLITGRRTIHSFNKDIVVLDKLKEAIDIARWAPNHHLTEPWHYYLLGKETIEAVIKLNTEINLSSKGEEAAKAKEKRWRTMPGWFVMTCANSEDPLIDKEDYASCCCAAQNLMLALWNEGIGVKWSTGDVIRDHRFYDLLWIDPAVETVVGLFWYGYPEEVPNTSRKSALQSITELP